MKNEGVETKGTGNGTGFMVLMRESQSLYTPCAGRTIGRWTG